MKTVVIVIVLFILVGLGGFLFMQHNKKVADMVASPTMVPSVVVSPSSSAPSPSSAMAGKMVNVTIKGSEFSFSPMTVTLKKDAKVHLTFENAGKFPHNFIIKDLNVATKTIQPGQQDTVDFTVNKAGSFQFICGVDSHADKGMIGTLIVQ
ncbi:MAG TPA: cupredoxin domain-containing protein [Methylomirabilota bacterium]|nr:cupredoxin domain-containing protein [Methylomirabilota bacterium]